MKLIKFLAVGAVILAALAGVYVLQVRSGSKSSIEIDPSNYYSTVLLRIYQYGDSIGAFGWDDELFDAAQVLVNNRKVGLSAADLHQLESTMQSVFIAKVDSTIRACYGHGMSSGDLDNHDRLRKSYAGLSKMGTAYQEIKSSERWGKLNDLRNTHLDIYAFGKRNHNLGSRLGLKLEWRHDTIPFISMNDMVNYDSYANTMRTKQTRLRQCRASFPELVASPWTEPILDAAALNATLAQGKQSYLAAEQSAVDTFAGSLVASISNHARQYGTPSKRTMRPLGDRLEQIITYLSERGINTTALGATKDQIRRIYIE